MVRTYMYENRNKNAQRKQREEQQVELRQQRRDDLLSKKRNTETSVSATIPNLPEYRLAVLSPNLEEVFRGVYEIRKLLSVESNPPIDEILDSGIVPRIIEFLSLSCPIYSDSDSDLVHNNRLESAWIVTNIASGSPKQTEALVDLGATRLLINVLQELNQRPDMHQDNNIQGAPVKEETGSTKGGPTGIHPMYNKDNLFPVQEDDNTIELIDQCIWALGNIAGDCESCRDVIIEQEGGIRIIELLNRLCLTEYISISSNPHIKVIRNCIWLLSNLCRGRDPQPEINHLRMSYEFFLRSINYDDNDILNDTMWGISYIADCDLELVETLLQSNIVEKVYSLLTALVEKYNREAKLKLEGGNEMLNPQYSRLDPLTEKQASLALHCISPLLRFLGNIATGSDKHTDFIVKYNYRNHNLISMLKTIFYSYDNTYKISRIRKEICWTLSNIAAGTKEQVNIMLHIGCHLLLIDALRYAELYVRIEACHAIHNMINFIEEEEDHFRCIISSALIEGLSEFMENIVNINEMVCLVLETFSKILEAGESWGMKSGEGNVAVGLFSEPLVRHIEELQDMENYDVSERAYNLIVKYFGGIEEKEN